MPMSGIVNSGGKMRRFMSVALIGLAIAGTSTVAAAQAAGQGQAGQAGRGGIRGGVGRARFDSTRARRMDSVRAARGDSARGRGGRGDMAMRGGLAGVKLTDAQKASMKEIHKQYGAELKQLRQQNDGKGTAKDATQKAALRAQLKAINDRENAEIRGILTPEQRTRFDANLAKKRDGNGRDKGHTNRK
jgi:Spy/CpxP family protein refolding chaperone